MRWCPPTRKTRQTDWLPVCIFGCRSAGTIQEAGQAAGRKGMEQRDKGEKRIKEKRKRMTPVIFFLGEKRGYGAVLTLIKFSVDEIQKKS